VSISRARGKLIVIADRAYYQRRAPQSPITRLIEAMAERGATAVPSDVFASSQ
jgi:hypothetical protein